MPFTLLEYVVRVANNIRSKFSEFSIDCNTNLHTRVLWNTYPVRCCCMKLCEIQLIAEEDYKFTYFCTVDNGDCIVYNQASMNMDLLN